MREKTESLFRSIPSRDSLARALPPSLGGIIDFQIRVWRGQNLGPLEVVQIGADLFGGREPRDFALPKPATGHRERNEPAPTGPTNSTRKATEFENASSARSF